VVGVSRNPKETANFILRKLRGAGYDAIPVNPATAEAEGTPCYPDVTAIPGAVDGVLVATHPAVSLQVARQSLDRGIRQIWFHRSFGDGSVSEEAVRECRARGVECLVGGCPLMYCAPVDFGHRCMRWWLRRGGRVPG
jgi:predicted CoA-binding protein